MGMIPVLPVALQKQFPLGKVVHLFCSPDNDVQDFQQSCCAEKREFVWEIPPFHQKEKHPTLIKMREMKDMDVSDIFD